MNIFGLDPHAKDRTCENEAWRETAPVGLTRLELKHRGKWHLVYFAAIMALCLGIAIIIDYWRVVACVGVVLGAFYIQGWLVRRFLRNDSL